MMLSEPENFSSLPLEWGFSRDEFRGLNRPEMTELKSMYFALQPINERMLGTLRCH